MTCQIVDCNSEHNRWLTYLVGLLSVAINVNPSYVHVFDVDTRNAFGPLITRHETSIPA